MEWQQEYPGLFSTNHEWARANDYELLEKKGRLYIVPVKDAVIENYRPFECYLDILEAFFKIGKKHHRINDQFNEWYVNLTSEPDREEYTRGNKPDHKECVEIIRFARTVWFARSYF